MNKLQYKRLLEMRESQEEMLKELIRMGIDPFLILKKGLIDGNRLHYILLKWTEKEIWEYGTSPYSGWFLKERTSKNEETDSGLTPLGTFLRKLRQDNYDILYDMAEKLSVSSSFLSSVEYGKKSLEPHHFALLRDSYSLTTEQCKELINASINTPRKSV